MRPLNISDEWETLSIMNQARVEYRARIMATLGTEAFIPCSGKASLHRWQVFIYQSEALGTAASASIYYMGVENIA